MNSSKDYDNGVWIERVRQLCQHSEIGTAARESPPCGLSFPETFILKLQEPAGLGLLRPGHVRIFRTADFKFNLKERLRGVVPEHLVGDLVTPVTPNENQV